MKVVGLLVVALFALVFSPFQAQAGWRQVFADEFNGSTLDRDQWFTRFIYGDDTLDHLNDEKEVYRDNDNHILKDGHLELTARYMGGDKYESGMIRSKRTFLYGYYEARVKFPSGKGVWPAFWLNPDYDADGKVSWPPEIDIFEFVNNGKDDTVKMVHSASDGDDKDGHLTYTDLHFNTHWSDYVSDTDLTTDWHVWGLMWLPDSFTVYMDGIKLYSKAYHWVRKDGTPAPPAHILLNLALGGQWAGRYGIDNDAFPQALGVDYVRVYQYDPNKSEGVHRCLMSPIWRVTNTALPQAVSAQPSIRRKCRMRRNAVPW